MPILITCTCGKRFPVGEGQAGKYVLCPGCGQSCLASVLGRKVGQGEKTKPPAVTIAWGPILKIGGIVAVVALVLIIYLGPMQVYKQYDAIYGAAHDDIGDVTVRGLEYATSSGMFGDPKSLRKYTPGIHDTMIYRPVMAMRMPEELAFSGQSTEGGFKGTYNTRTHVVTNVADVGQLSLPGVPVKRGGRKVTIVGTSTKGKLDVTVDGVKVPG